MKRTLEYICDKTGGILSGGTKESLVNGVAIDSRLVTEGNIFFALSGQHVDGHDFVGAALANGAAAAVVKQDFSVPAAGPLIRVAAPLQALQDLARAYRREFTLPVVAITGSVGKTTTKEILSSCLSPVLSTMKNEGNFNNELGLPLSLLKLDESYQAAVLEMGMRAPGEIRKLCTIADPQHAVITNVAGVHLETLGSLENIAKAKCEILERLRPGTGSFALLNGDNPLLLQAARDFNGRIYYFGHGDHCQLHIKQIETDRSGMRIEACILGQWEYFKFPLPVKGWAANIIAAVGAAYLLGVPMPVIKTQLSGYRTLSDRLHMIPLSGGGKIINDSYNANPLSTISALETGRTLKGNSPYVAVLGDMFELGHWQEEGHRLVGKAAFDNQVGQLVLVGDLAKEIGTGAIQAGMPADHIAWFASREDCVDYLERTLSGQETVLFKASRGMRFEWIVGAITNKMSAPAAQNS